MAGLPPKGVGASIWFDGHRGQLRVRRLGSGRRATLSSPQADADNPTGDGDSRGHDALAFTEWQHQHVALRVATRSAGRWRVDTLETSKESIYSPRVVRARDGTFVVSWIASDRPKSVLRAAVLRPGGAWERPVTLERGSGIRSAGLAPTLSGAVVSAWRDNAGTETRARASTWDGRRWSTATSVATTLERMPSVTISDDGSVVGWAVGYASRRLVFWHAHRRATSWVRKPKPVRVIHHYVPAVPIDPFPVP